MKSHALNITGVSRKIMRIIKELKTVKAKLKSTKDKFAREMFGSLVHDLTAKLAWALIECDRYEESYALARTLPWRTYARNRYLCEGTSLIHLKRLADARVLLEAGARRYPDFVPILVSLGNCYTRLNEHEKALECQERALALYPRDPKILFNKAADIYNLGFYEDAMAILQKMLRKRPRDPWCHALMGHCYNQIGYPEDARRYFTMSIAGGYPFVDAHEGLFHTFYDQGMRNDAISAALEGLRRFPGQEPELYMNLAATYHEMGWTKEAIDVIQQAIAVFPEDKELKEWLEELEDDMNDPDKGEEVKKPKILLFLADRKRKKILS